jgi:hypothetical protein
MKDPWDWSCCEYGINNKWLAKKEHGYQKYVRKFLHMQVATNNNTTQLLPTIIKTTNVYYNISWWTLKV